MPNFTLTALSGFVDTLRLASDVGDRSRRERCPWQIVGENLNPVRASCGVQMTAWTTFKDAEDFDYVVVIGGLLHSGPETSEATLEYLRKTAAAGKTLIGICTGAFALARAGLVTHQRICVSWFHYHDFLARFPSIPSNLVVADSLFVSDGNLITCSGGPVSIDVAAAILRRHIEPAVIVKALRILQVGGQREWNAPQPHPPSVTSHASPRIRRAIALMEQHLSSPLSPEELARRLDTSQRQLERLFNAETGMSPVAYGRRIRLHIAAWLLRHSEKNVLDIADFCGFTDASHMGREFKRSLGITPKECREAEPERMPEALRTLLGGRSIGTFNPIVPDSR